MVLGTEVFNEEVKSAITEAYFFLADILISKEREMKQEKIQGGWDGWRKMILKKKVVETSKHTSFYFIPEDEKPLMMFKPGQYISVRTPETFRGEVLVRNYSLSNKAWDEEYYRITVKKDGQMSSYLHEQLSEGDILEMGPPCGWLSSENNSKPLVLFGTGTGITPLMSILSHAVLNKRSTVFIYRVHSAEMFPFKHEIDQIIEKADDNISMHVFYSVHKEETVKPMEYNEETIELMIRDKESDFYICGPMKFTALTIEFLSKIGIDEENIQVASFGPMTNQK